MPLAARSLVQSPVGVVTDTLYRYHQDWVERLARAAEADVAKPPNRPTAAPPQAS